MFAPCLETIWGGEVPQIWFLGLCLDSHYFSTGVVPKFGFYFSRRAVAQALVGP